MYWNPVEMGVTVAENKITINSAVLKRQVTCTILMPEENYVAEPFNLLLLNDGQESENLLLKETLEDLNGTNRIKPLNSCSYTHLRRPPAGIRCCR